MSKEQEEQEAGSFGDADIDPDTVKQFWQSYKQREEQRRSRILDTPQVPVLAKDAPAIVTLTDAKASARSWIKDNGLILSDGSVGAVLPNGRVVRYREGTSFLRIDDTDDELVAVIRQWVEPRDEDEETLKAQLEQSPSWNKCLERFSADYHVETPDQRVEAMQDSLNRYGLPYTPAMARYALSQVDQTEQPNPPTRGGIVTTFVLAICYDFIPLPSGFTFKQLYEYQLLQQTIAPANWTTSAFRERAEALLTHHSKAVNAWQEYKGDEFKRKITGDLRGLNKRDASGADPELYADARACIAKTLDRQTAKDRAISRLEERLSRKLTPDEKNRAKKQISDLIYNLEHRGKQTKNS